MAGFTDLVDQAQPAIFGNGVSARVTEGQTWRFRFEDIVDNAGTTIDLSSGITGTCKIYEDATEVATLTVTCGDGYCEVSATKAATANLANSVADGRKCRWKCELDNGTESVTVWGQAKSTLTIFAKDGVA